MNSARPIVGLFAAGTVVPAIALWLGAERMARIQVDS